MLEAEVKVKTQKDQQGEAVNKAESRATMAPLQARFGAAFYAVEAASSVVFAGEWALRVWTCVEARKYRAPVWGRRLLVPLSPRPQSSKASCRLKFRSSRSSAPTL